MRHPNRILLTLLLFLTCSVLRAQFRPVYMGADSTDDINGMCFLTPSTGFVAFSKFIGFTQDSGRTYVQRTITFNNTDYNGYPVTLTFGFFPQGVLALSTDSLLVFGHFSFEPSILFSADQGQTWKVVFHLPLNVNAPVLSSGVTALQFPGNGSVGIAVHNEGILRSTDRGQTWSTVLSAPNQLLRKLSFPTPAIGYASGGAYVLQTTTSGTSWMNVAPAGVSNANFNNVFFTTTANGYVTDAIGNGIYRTTNSAASWQLMNYPSVDPLGGNDLWFTNDSTGYAASPYLYQVQKTVNYGKTWELCPKTNPYQYLYFGENALFFLGSNTGWAGGKGEYLMITSNGGGPTLPRAYFTVDTSGLSRTDSVKLINLSNSGYLYQWYRNDTLIGNTYNLEYAHNIFRLRDTVMLVVRNGANSDTMVQYVSFPPPVLIDSYSPTTGSPGSVITIKGTGFTGAAAVSFGGIAATTFTVVSDTLIVATVGNGASGSIALATPTGSASIPGFIYAPPPNINLPMAVADSIVCKSGPVSLSIQNTENGVSYTLIDSLGNTYGSAAGNGGTITLNSTPVSVTGHYTITAARISTGLTATFTTSIFLLVENPHSVFGSDKLNVLAAEAVEYYNRSTGAATFQWTFNQDASTGGSTSPVVTGVTYGSAGQKTLQLISTSINGCPDTVAGNAVFVYSGTNPSNTCFVDAIDHADTIPPNLTYQTWSDFTPAPNDGYMVCGTGTQSVVTGRAGVSATVPGSSSVYANYSANGVLRWTDYVTTGTIGSSAVDASGNIYLTGICNSASWFHFGNGDSMEIYVAPTETQPVWSKNNGFIIKLDPNGNYLWHTVIYDPSAIYQGYPVEGGQGTKIRVFGNRVIVLGSFLANLAYVRNGVLTPLYLLPNDQYPNDLQNNFIFCTDTSGALQWSAYTHNTATNQEYALADIGTDSLGNLYLVGHFEDGMQLYDAGNVKTTLTGQYATSNGFLIKFDPSGHELWDVYSKLAVSFRDVPFNGFTVDAAGNSYVTGNTILIDTTQYFVVTNSDGSTVRVARNGWFLGKFNSNGILQWMQGNGWGSSGVGYAVALNGSDVYALGSYVSNAITDYAVTVTSGGGAGGGSGGGAGGGAGAAAGGAVDSLMTTGTELFLAKYSTAGVLERVNRSGGNNGGHMYGNGLFVDSHKNIVLSGGTDYYNGGDYSFQFFGGTLAARASNVWFGKLDSGICMVNSIKPVDAGPGQIICNGDSVTLGGNLTGDSVYWSSNPAGFTSSSTNPVVHPGVTTTYYVILNNPGGTVSQDSVTITVHPVYNYAGAAATICAGNSDTLGIAAGLGSAGGTAVQYAWTSLPAGFSSGEARPVVDPTATTAYFVRVVDGWGCVSSDTVTLTVATNTLAQLPSMDTAVCPGQSVVIGMVDNVDRWSWSSSPPGFTSNVSNPAVTPATNTSYYAIVTNSLGCAGGDTVTVRIRAVPPQPVIKQLDSVTLQSSADTGNQWYYDTTRIITGATGMTYQPGRSDYYSVRVTDSGCVSPFAALYKYMLPVVTPPGGTGGTTGDSTYVTIGPNPTTGELLLQFRAPGVTTVSVEVVDMAGQVSLFFDNLVTGAHLSLAVLPKGLYVLKVTSPDGSLRATKEVLKL